MKKLLLLGLSTFAMSAHAWEPSYYVGGNFSPWQVKSHAISPSFSIQTLEGVGGVVLFKHLAIEARVGAGINEGRETRSWIDVEPDPVTGEDTLVEYYENLSAEISYFASAYLRPFIANEKATLYGLLGMTTISMDNNFGDDDSDTAASFGFGVSFKMSPNVDITAEWKKLINADEFDVRGGTVGFTYTF